MIHKFKDARKVGGMRVRSVRRKGLNPNTDPEMIIGKLFDGLQGSKPLPDVSSVSLLVKPSSDAEAEASDVQDAEAIVTDVEENGAIGAVAEHEQFNYPLVRICTKVRVISVSGDRVAMSDADREKVTFPTEKDEEMLKEEADADGKSNNKFLRRFKETLRKKKVQLEYLPRFQKVVLCIQKANYNIVPAKVARVAGKNFYLIWGEMTPEENEKPEFDLGALGGDDAIIDLDDEDAPPELVSADFNFEAAAELDAGQDAGQDAADTGADHDAVPPPLEESDQEVEIPDGATFSPNDVGIVVDQTGCTQKQAVSALSAENGDLVAAVLALT